MEGISASTEKYMLLYIERPASNSAEYVKVLQHDIGQATLL